MAVSTLMPDRARGHPVPRAGYDEQAEAGRLVTAARLALAEADLAAEPGERYVAAHLAALRAAAAVLAERTPPSTSRPRRPTSAWTLLAKVAPELSEWAAFFAAGADRRAAAQAGARGAVTQRQADDLMRDATEFVGIVEAGLGMLPLTLARTDAVRSAL